MRKKQIISVLFAMLFCLNGCQSAPQASSDQDIFRAQEPEESKVQSIAMEQNDMEKNSNAGENVDLVLGEGEHAMHIKATFPAVSEAPGTLIMQADSSLDEERLKAFLEPQGEVQNITQEYLKECEEEEQRAIDAAVAAGEDPEGVVVHMGSIGDINYMVRLTDGNRTAGCAHHFFVSYKDDALWGKCMDALRKCGEEADAEESASFSAQAAKDLLIRKLALIGITEVSLRETHAYEADGFCLYEMTFTPSLGGIGIKNQASGTAEEILPIGFAWVSMEGVASIDLSQYCMQEAERESGQTYGFDRLTEILEVYLEKGDILCHKDVPYTKLELVYYPVLKEGRLYLVPAWNIGMPLDVYVEEFCEEYPDICWDICINAITGELIEVN